MPISKDEELKKLLTEKLQQDKQNEMRTQLANDRHEARQKQLDELIKGRYTKNERGERIDRWEEVIQNANKAISTAVESYTDWRAAMSSLISLYTDLNKALGQDLKELFYFMFNKGSDIIKPMVIDPLREKWSAKPEVVLPGLSYLVNADSDNKITIEPLKGFKDDDLVPQDLNNLNDRLVKSINDTFKKGVHKWLNDLDYKESAKGSGKWLHKDTGEELTQERFNQLKNDPEKGLSQVLSEHFDLDLSEKHQAVPRP